MEPVLGLLFALGVIPAEKLAERWRLRQAAKAFDRMYPDAGRNAQPEIREALKRWKKLPVEEQRSGPLWFWLLGDATPVYKLPPAEVKYTAKSPIAERTCGNCKYAYQNVVTKKYICSVIRGFIVPPGWCQLWDAPEPGFQPGHA